MGDNATLTSAKKAKQDEFYTQYADIQTEMNAYLEYDPGVFKGKTILLPCDDPEWSNFTRYFAENFSALGLKKLISTSYSPEAKTAKYGSLFEYAASQDDATPKNERGKIFVLDHDVTGDGKVNFDDINVCARGGILQVVDGSRQELELLQFARLQGRVHSRPWREVVYQS